MGDHRIGRDPRPSIEEARPPFHCTAAMCSARVLSYHVHERLAGRHRNLDLRQCWLTHSGS